MIFVIKVYV